MADGPTHNAVAPASPGTRPRFRYQEDAVPAAAPAGAQAAAAPTLMPLAEDTRKRLLTGSLFLAIGFSSFFLLNWIQLASIWARDASWSHGFAVPVLSGVLIFLNWDHLRRLPVRSSRTGLFLLLYGILSQILFSATGQLQMSNLSMLVVLFGAALFVLGWEQMKVLWLPIGFLLFMIPPPQTLYVRLTTPMQNIAAAIGVHLLPLFGVDAYRAGTTIGVRTATQWDSLNVAEACSGIRMLVAFGALAVVLAYSTPRPMWQKLFLAWCAAPVAILCNALRVTLTGVMHVYAGASYAEGSAHEMLGFLMLVPAGLMQLGLAAILDRIFVEEPEAAPAAGGGAA